MVAWIIGIFAVSFAAPPEVAVDSAATCAEVWTVLSRHESWTTPDSARPNTRLLNVEVSMAAVRCVTPATHREIVRRIRAGKCLVLAPDLAMDLLARREAVRLDSPVSCVTLSEVDRIIRRLGRWMIASRSRFDSMHHETPGDNHDFRLPLVAEWEQTFLDLPRSEGPCADGNVFDYQLGEKMDYIGLGVIGTCSDGWPFVAPVTAGDLRWSMGGNVSELVVSANGGVELRGLSFVSLGDEPEATRLLRLDVGFRLVVDLDSAPATKRRRTARE